MGKPDIGKAKTAGCICMRLRKASRRVTQIYDHSLQDAGMTVTQFSLLSHIASLDGIGIGPLADKMVMDPTTLTRNLKPLERRGLVAVKADRTDKRLRCLHVTSSGRGALDNAKPAWSRAQRQVERALGEVEAPALSAALDLVLERLAP